MTNLLGLIFTLFISLSAKADKTSHDYSDDICNNVLHELLATQQGDRVKNDVVKVNQELKAAIESKTAAQVMEASKIYPPEVVSRLENSDRLYAAQNNYLKSKITQIEAEAATRQKKSESLSWFKRNFSIFFWKNETVIEIKNINQAIAQLEASASEIQKRLDEISRSKNQELNSANQKLRDEVERYSKLEKDLNQQIKNTLDDFLEKHFDPAIVLIASSNELESIKTQTHRVISEVDEALDAVDSAQTTELFDLVSDNALVSLWSHSNNSDAASEIKDIRAPLQELKNKIDALKKNSLSSIPTSHDLTLPDDFFDTVIDLLFDFSFDFSSFFSLSRLGDSEDELNSLSTSLSELVSEVDKKQKLINQKLDDYACMARGICLGDQSSLRPR